MKVRLTNRLVVGVLSLLLGVRSASAAVKSGNEYALSLVEAKTPAAQKSSVAEGMGKQHFFRYLEVLELKKADIGGYPTIGLKTREPSSGMIIKFLVQKSISLSVLLEEPATAVGDAVAVTGVIESADPVKRTMVLNPVIVRIKTCWRRRSARKCSPSGIHPRSFTPLRVARKR